ncbi:hypothetical protein HK103_004509 [Boothiomyces macroporosus]|uniref:Uncharacterized protein n=1 Tax=Boothiomyces macroporosus TaxID=261099 RepID=A0AAD5UGF9_9FUNG|nr:hypothetical protein HK103_004509 [Boothiomyces macroporosus]
MSDFAEQLTNIAIAQILNLIGVDRIHGTAHQVFVEVVQAYLQLLAKKAKEAANLCGRTQPCLLDLMAPLDQLEIHPKELLDYLQAIKLQNQSQFKFPRKEPATFPIKVASDGETKENLEPNGTSNGHIENGLDMEVDVQKGEIIDEKFPPLPTEEDYHFEVEAAPEVPDIEIIIEEPDPEIVKPSENIYFKTISFQEAKDTYLKNYHEFDDMRVEIPQAMNDTSELESLLLEALDACVVDDTHAPLNHETTLGLLVNRINLGVAIPEPSSCGYETKSIIGDLLIARLPLCNTVLGGEKLSEQEAKMTEDLIGLSRIKKKEKERDSGQGKAPVKLSAAKLAKREAMLLAKLERGAITREQFELTMRMESQFVKQDKKDNSNNNNINSNQNSEQVQSLPQTPATSNPPVTPNTSFFGSALGNPQMDVEVSHESVKSNIIKTPQASPVKMKESPLPTKQSPQKLKLKLSKPVKLTSPKSPEEVINCICSNPTLDDGLFMVSCDKCFVWFHGHCVNVTSEVGDWRCHRCSNK